MNDARVVPDSSLAAGQDGAGGAPFPWPGVEVDGDLARARGEWLHTNGAGAYASSTIAGLHTRRYHGLLVAALEPPAGRHVFLSHVDATVSIQGVGADHAASGRAGRPRWELAKHQFPGVDPESTPFHLHRFDQDPLPRWTYRVAGGELEVTLALVRGENAVVLRYAFRAPAGREAPGAGPLALSLRPLLAARHYHQLLEEHGGMLQRVELRRHDDPREGQDADPAGEMRVQPRRDLPRVCFRYEGTFVGSPDWWRRFEYLTERDRGLPFQEDLWTPGVFEVPLGEGPRYLVAAVDKLPSGSPAALLEAARAALVNEDPGPDASPAVRRLTLAAEAFRADLAPTPAVVAGYPWYEDGVRDALIALPGLYLVAGKHDRAVEVIRAIARSARDGIVPDPRGGGADATLWLFDAAGHVAEGIGHDHAASVGDLLPSLRDAFHALLDAGRTDPGALRVTAEGLVAAGAPGEAATWMDARIDGVAITSRAGCPIELTALWARGCDVLARLAHAASDLELRDRAVARRDAARAAFARRFWCAEIGYPYDVVFEAGDPRGAGDPAVRPNALLALAIDPACFSDEQADAVLARVRRDLLTPAGIRSLAPREPGYVGCYAGGVAERDRAFHQGSAWPWLLGAFARASARRGADRRELTRLCEAAAQNVIALGHVPEIADGDAPHTPRGAVAHAAGVAELLRALAWDLPP